MPRLSNVRGMLLEEALLHLLETGGYKTVQQAEDDPTLENGPVGLKLKGRGSSHQIDAIADFRIHQPFSHPQRLLVEAKCYDPNQPVALPVVRGAVGTLKDVSEYWVAGQGGKVPKQRYHYQYAIFSATGYTRDAQDYAFAQDVYLIPLAESAFFLPVIQAIRNVTSANPNEQRNPNVPFRLSALRRAVRHRIREPDRAVGPALPQFAVAVLGIPEFVGACSQIGFSLLAVLGGRFPVFLVPAPNLRLDQLVTDYEVRIFRGPNDQTWYLRDPSSNQDLFSFDLPRELFLRYADHGMLRARAAVDLKLQEMTEFEAVFVRDERPELVRFRLDLGWLDGVRANIERRRLE